MSTFKAKLFFSTLPYKAFYLSLSLLFGLIGMTKASGPEPDWYQINQHSPNDPKYPSSNGSIGIFDEFLPSIYRSSTNKIELNQFQLDMTSLVKMNHPSLPVLFTDNDYKLFAKKHCINRKYLKLMNKFRSAGGKASPTIRAKKISDFPAYDIPQEGIIPIDLKQRNYGYAGDAYSIYLSIINNIIGNCYFQKKNQPDWHQTQFFLSHIQKIQQLETQATVLLIIGALNNGEKKLAEKQLNFLSQKALSKKMTALIPQIRVILDDHQVMDHLYPINMILRANRWSWGVCASNNLKNIKDFVTDVIENKTLNDHNVGAILTLRMRLYSECSNRDKLIKISQEFGENRNNKYTKYLYAASLFYLSEFKQAISVFDEIANEGNGWIEEASLYLSARSQHKASQKNWQVWDRKKKGLDIDLLLKSASSFKKYLKHYPTGRYTRSAKGLIRRSYWIAGQNDKYQQRLMSALEESLKTISTTPDWEVGEIIEIRNFLIELRRFFSVVNTANPMLPLEVIFNNQQIIWKGKKREDVNRILTYISMYKFYSKTKYTNIIQEYQPNVKALNQAEILILLRALEKSGDYEQAVELWFSKDLKSIYAKKYLSNKIKYEAAETIFQGIGLEALMRESRIQDDILKYKFISSYCDETSLSSMLKSDLSIKNQAIIFDSLAKRYLVSQRFEALDELMESKPKAVVQNFTTIKTALNQLTNKQQQGKAYMNIAYFMNQRLPSDHGGYSDAFKQDESVECNYSPELQSTMIENASPYYYFNKSLEFFGEEKSSSEEKSLYYLTMCFKLGKSRSCLRGASYPNGLTSKQAFTKLHTKYKQGKWAIKAKYYY